MVHNQLSIDWKATSAQEIVVGWGVLAARTTSQNRESIVATKRFIMLAVNMQNGFDNRNI